ncbi:hypothetical protein EOM39_00410 [Candidatus Gracilibacteria bacterium]|nr:hypothetical protein [Candidatus Gracilibacteria bacterium]
MKKIIYSLLGVVFLGLNYVNAMNLDNKKTDSGLIGSSDSADTAIQGLIGKAIGFLYLVAVVYALWGGFQILTAAGKEEQVKKGRTIIVQALIGLVVIWLANSIVGWVVNSILSSGGN